MYIDPHRLAAFFHVVLFAYWLGADLGVFLCGRAARRKDISDEARAIVRRVGHLVDMGPRTAAVLMVPVGLYLAAQYGSPITGLPLVLIAAASLVWLWMVWTFFLQPTTPLGRTCWKIDIVLRSALMVAFIGSGIYCWATGTPIEDRWLAAKLIVFGLILLDGVFLRLVLFWQDKQARAGKAPPPGTPPTLLQKSLMYAVLTIWALVATAAFLGIVKPF